MLAILKTFGGIFPALSKRALPGDAAQVNANLLASVPHFQPVMSDLPVAVSGVANPKTIYRLDRKIDGAFNTDMTTGWVVNAKQVSYAKGPINNDVTERTYYTFDDGSAPPRWLDVAGNDRQLGVPKPAAAPTVVVGGADEFTPEDRITAITAAIEQMTQAVRNRLTAVWKGGAYPVDTPYVQTGYVNMQPGYSTTPNQGKQARLYQLTSTDGAGNGSLWNAYGLGKSLEPNDYTFAYDPAVKSTIISDATLPSWANAGAPAGHIPDNLAITFTAYGLTYSLDAAGLTADLAAIAMPGTSDGTKLFTAAQVSALVDRISSKLVGTNIAVSLKVKSLEFAVNELHTMLDGGLMAVVEAQYTAYFASSAIVTLMDNELTTWAGRLFDIASQIMSAGAPADTSGFNGVWV